MRFQVKRAGWLVNWLALVVAAGLVPVSAEVQIYTVNAGSSSLALQGTTGGAAWQEQGDGGLVTGFSGWLVVDMEPDLIQFLAGGVVSGTQTNPWQPPSEPDAATPGPADYGGEVATGTGIGAGRDVLALRNLSVRPTSDPIPLVNGQFDASALNLSLPSAGNPVLNYWAFGLVVLGGEHSLGGQAATNAATGGYLIKPILPDAGTSLTVPVDLTLPAFSLPGGDTQLRFTGTLTGVRGGNLLVTPVLLRTPSAVIPGSFTLYWDANFLLQRATDLGAGDWTDYLVSAPFDVPLDAAAAFYRVVY